MSAAARNRLFCRREERVVSAVVQRGPSCRRKEQADCRHEEQTILPPRGAGCFRPSCGEGCFAAARSGMSAAASYN